MSNERAPIIYKGVHIISPGTHIEITSGIIHKEQRILRDQGIYQRNLEFKRNNKAIHQRLEDLGITEGYVLDLTDENGNEHAITGILGKFNSIYSTYYIKQSEIRNIGAFRLASLSHVDISDIIPSSIEETT